MKRNCTYNLGVIKEMVRPKNGLDHPTPEEAVIVITIAAYPSEEEQIYSRL